MKKRWKITILMLLALALTVFHDICGITADQVLNWQPENLILAAFVLLCFFAVKSALIFIPIMLPQLLAGHIYDRDTAILINILGLVVVMSVPYLMGKHMGSEKMEKLIKKYPKISTLLKVQDENEMAFCFMLRACCVPPADIVTMYLGASGVTFTTNVIGGVLGAFPGMVLHTFLGANIRNPESPAFWKALALNVAWVILSGLGFWLFRKAHSVDKEGGDF